jgi:hypothetical protein
MSTGHDSPVSRREDDVLERWGVARAIHRVIASSPSGWSTRIGLYGRWGTGKTTVLNFLEAIEGESKSLVVRMSAWSAGDESDLIATLYEALDRKLATSSDPVRATSRLKKVLHRAGLIVQSFGVSEVAGSAADGYLPGAGTALKAAGNFVLSKLRLDRADLEELRALATAAGHPRVVVFIDDLDRADPRLLPKALLALREMLDWPDFAFVLAFDKAVIARALGEYSSTFGDSADRFLEKVIDVPFDLPAPTAAQAQRLAEQALGACCGFLPVEVRRRIAPWLPPNPRTAKLIARRLGALQSVAARHDPDEVDWFAIGVQTSLRLVLPPLAERVESDMLGIGKDLREHFADAAGGKRDPSEAIAEAVAEFVTEDWSESDRRWLRGLVETVKLARRTHTEPKILYEMGLLVDEPPFTWREYRQVVEAWIATPTSDTLAAAIEAAERRSGKSAIEAADGFVGSAIAGYDQALDQAALTSGQPAYDAAMAKAAMRLQLLEALFGGAVTGALQTACGSKRQCAALFGVLQQWLHFRVNRQDAALRDRELELLTAALSRCAEPKAMYQATDPRRDNGLLEYPGLDPAAKRLWLEEARAPLINGVLAEVVSWFVVPDGVASQGIGEGELFGTWLIESPDSPLYRDEGSRSALRDVFLKAVEKPSDLQSEHVRDNAFTYLLWLTEGRRSGSWIEPEKRPAFLKKHSELVCAAWSAITAVPHQHRALHGLAELRRRLLTTGLLESDLPLVQGLNQDDHALPEIKA